MARAEAADILPSMPVSDEHRERFLTYKNYVGAIALELRDAWAPSPYPMTFDAARAASSSVQGVRGSASELYTSLSRGWAHLLTLWRDTQDDVYEEANAWTPAKAWYAVHHGFGALQPLVAPQEAKRERRHEQTLRLLRQLVVQRKLIPHPYDLCVTGYGPDIDYHGFSVPPATVNTLTFPGNTDYENFAATFLRSTAKHRSQRVIAQWRKETGRKNVLTKYRPEIVKRLGATCVFDLLYRLRTRANYGDVDTFVVGAFVVGAFDAREAREFAQDLLVVTDGALGCIEGVLTAYVGLPVYRKAVEKYMADRKPLVASPVGRRFKHVAKLSAAGTKR